MELDTSVTGNITNNAALVFNAFWWPVYSGVISGTGTVTKTGTGSVTLTGMNTYTGNTTVAQGVLQLGDGTTNGSIVGDISNNDSLIFNTSWGTQTYPGVISGSGSVEKRGAGTLILTGSNNFAGGIAIIAGTLQMGGDAAAAFTGNVTNSTALVLGNGTFSGAVSGTGTTTKTGAGTMIYTGSNTCWGNTTVSAGTLQLGNGITNGSTGNIVNNAAIVFDNGSDQTYSAVINGTGTVTKIGAGTLSFTGSNAYSGGTLIEDGVLQLGDGEWLDGSVNGNITNNAALIFNPAWWPAYSGVISGTGTVTKKGRGMTVLTGANTYTGKTTVSAGVLKLSGGDNRLPAVTAVSLANTAGVLLDLNGQNQTVASLSGGGNNGGNVALGFAGVLTVGDATSTTYAGVISDNYFDGGGRLVKQGPGTLTLSGANTYLGGTTVNAGTLALGADNALPTRSNVILNGGTLATNGFSQTNSLGKLTLSANSTIDMGVLGNSTLKFVDDYWTPWSGTLTIANWNGSFNGGGADELLFGSWAMGLNSNQLSNIIFTSPNGLSGNYQARILATGEIVPVPEPATIALLVSGGFLLGRLALRRWRRRTVSA